MVAIQRDIVGRYAVAEPELPRHAPVPDVVQPSVPKTLNYRLLYIDYNRLLILCSRL